MDHMAKFQELTNSPKVLIIGANGNIGSHIFIEMTKHPNFKVIKSTRNFDKDSIKFDLNCDDPSIKFLFLDHNDIVIILSGIASPKTVFNDLENSYTTNVTSTIKLINYLKTTNCKIIYFSSVEVFDGSAAPYNENSDCNPLNEYGKQKYLIEKYLRENISTKKYKIIRIPWNISLNVASNCVVKNTYDLIEKGGGSIVCDYDISVISTLDTARITAMIIKKFNLIDSIVIHLASNEFVNRLELADYILKNSTYLNRKKFKVINFEDLILEEPRARDTRMNNLLSKKLLNIEYTEIWSVIRDKINLLDYNRVQ